MSNALQFFNQGDQDAFLDNIEARDYGFSYIQLLQKASKLIEENEDNQDLKDNPLRPGQIVSEDLNFRFDRGQPMKFIPMFGKKFWRKFNLSVNPKQPTYIESIEFLDYKGPYEVIEPDTGNTIQYKLVYQHFVFLEEQIKKCEGNPLPYIISYSGSKNKAAGIINQNANMAKKRGKHILASLTSFEVKGDNPYWNYKAKVYPHKQLEELLKGIKDPQTLEAFKSQAEGMREASLTPVVTNNELEAGHEVKQIPARESEGPLY